MKAPKARNYFFRNFLSTRVLDMWPRSLLQGNLSMEKKRSKEAQAVRVQSDGEREKQLASGCNSGRVSSGRDQQS